MNKKQDKESQNINSIVKSLKGSFKISKNIDYKKVLNKRTKIKYL